MSAKSYAFKVGAVTGAVLLDGASIIGKEGLMKRFPDPGDEAEYHQAHADMGLALDEADNSMNILLLKIGPEIVLVDAGMGGGANGGWLPESLKLAGINPRHITLVVVTHTHGDHVLGLLSPTGAPAFPAARYMISSVEMASWQARIRESIPDQQVIVDMMERAGLQQIDMDAEILPGLRALPLPGHTPGHIGLRLESEGETLLHMVDLLHSPMQFAHPEWSARFDADTRVSVPTRREALGQAADTGTLTLFYHLTFPGLGYVRRAANDFAWQPLAE